MAQNASVKVATNARLIDGTGKKVVKDTLIVIKCNTIKDVGKVVDTLYTVVVEVNRGI